MNIQLNDGVSMVLIGVGIGVPALCLLVGAVRFVLVGFKKEH